MNSAMERVLTSNLVDRLMGTDTRFSKLAQTGKPWYMDQGQMGAGMPDLPEVPDMAGTPDLSAGADLGQPQEGGEDQALKDEIFGTENFANPAGADVQGAIADSAMRIKAEVVTMAKALYNIDLAEEDAMKIVKTTVKTISNDIADVPIQQFIDRIDNYLDGGKSKSKTQAPPAPNAPAAPGAPTAPAPAPAPPAPPTGVEEPMVPAEAEAAPQEAGGLPQVQAQTLSERLDQYLLEAAYRNPVTEKADPNYHPENGLAPIDMALEDELGAALGENDPMLSRKRPVGEDGLLIEIVNDLTNGPKDIPVELEDGEEDEDIPVEHPDVMMEASVRSASRFVPVTLHEASRSQENKRTAPDTFEDPTDGMVQELRALLKKR